MPSLTLKPCGEDRSRIKCHLLDLCFLGITPNGLVWMADFLAVSARPTSAILPKANSVAMYLETTSGWLLVDNMFPPLLRSWEELCWNPILNPCSMPFRIN